MILISNVTSIVYDAACPIIILIFLKSYYPAPSSPNLLTIRVNQLGEPGVSQLHNHHISASFRKSIIIYFSQFLLNFTEYLRRSMCGLLALFFFRWESWFFFFHDISKWFESFLWRWFTLLCLAEFFFYKLQLLLLLTLKNNVFVCLIIFSFRCCLEEDHLERAKVRRRFFPRE